MYEWVIIVSILQGTSGLVLNTLAWLVILRTKSLHNMTNYLLAYLAVVDSIFCCYLIAFFATLENQLPQSFIGKEIYCRIVKSGFLLTFIAYSSTCALCLVTYERYIGIVHPLHYPRKMSAKKVIMIIFIALGILFLLSSPNLLKLNANNDTSSLGCGRTYMYSFLKVLQFVLLILVAYLSPILFMSWAYYKIQATLKRSAQRFQQQNVQGAALELLQARQNVIRMLRIVMGAAVVLWTPITCKMIFCTVYSMRDLCYTNSSGTFSDIFSSWYNMNPVINPIIYIFTYKKFRKGLQDMLCRCIGRPLRPNRIGDLIAMNEQNALHKHQERM